MTMWTAMILLCLSVAAGVQVLYLRGQVNHLKHRVETLEQRVESLLSRTQSLANTMYTVSKSKEDTEGKVEAILTRLKLDWVIPKGGQLVERKQDEDRT